MPAAIQIRQGMVERTGLERQLREAQKFEAVGRLASRLAHEFNQVLSVIGNQTGVIMSKLKPDDPLQVPVEGHVQKRGTSCRIDGATSGADIHEPTVRDRLSLGPVIEAMRETLRGLLPGRIDLHVASDSTTALVEIS